MVPDVDPIPGEQVKVQQTIINDLPPNLMCAFEVCQMRAETTCNVPISPSCFGSSKGCGKKICSDHIYKHRYFNLSAIQEANRHRHPENQI